VDEPLLAAVCAAHLITASPPHMCTALLTPLAPLDLSAACPPQHHSAVLGWS
jgi:hypothetical protein